MTMGTRRRGMRRGWGGEGMDGGLRVLMVTIDICETQVPTGEDNAPSHRRLPTGRGTGNLASSQHTEWLAAK